MSHDSHFMGDPATFSNAFDDVYETDCDCGWTGEVPCSKEYKHGVTYIFGDWTCPSCNESHTLDIDYEDDGGDY